VRQQKAASNAGATLRPSIFNRFDTANTSGQFDCQQCCNTEFAQEMIYNLSTF
jgi:hypothetical protein